MTDPNGINRAKAALHHRHARQYRRLASFMSQLANTLDYEPETCRAAAGSLLYEAAKQHINAVSNQSGQNPQDNREKRTALHAIANSHPDYANLPRGAVAAWLLHIHADQFNLSDGEYAAYMAEAAQFAAAMDAIYQRQISDASI